ncbi:SIR2 family protein [Olivibacter sp. 47]|uniref:SIR2 family protein n=1 Tax=Olivibacter sp. 47 TaxID=3056486 RepID=UPI0025A35329|nr:SIR2 family protein [Olivibacter sp. 47]MDM8172913.1 SIR2 family protein [Olivibacter sp. 47]
MKQKHSVFLFGAGAALSWGAPKTSELTEMVLNSGYLVKGEDVTITQFIYNVLLDNGYQERDVNFETIINVIEELVVFYSKFDYRSWRTSGGIPSLPRCFSNAIFEDKLLNFEIVGGIVKHGYQIKTRKRYGAEYISSHCYHDEAPEQFFFQHLLLELYTAITTRIIEYAYHSQESSSIDTESTISQNFIKWMKQYLSKNSVKLYTLNYDRLFKILLEKSGHKIFEGFDCGEFIQDEQIRANILKILSDFDTNSHYNLHGSIYWDLEGLDKHSLPNAELFLSSYPNLQSNYSPSSFQMEKGKTMLLTNIITGYQKAQRGMLSPIKQMQASFDRSSVTASHLFIIGYSFGDEHINESIKIALRYNKDIIVHVVDPGFIKNDINQQFIERFVGSRSENPILKKLEINLYSIFDWPRKNIHNGL